MTTARSTRVTSCILLILAAPLASPLAAPLPTHPPVQLATEEALAAPEPPTAPVTPTHAPLDIEGMRRSVRETGMVDAQATPSTSTSTSVFSSAPPADVERFKQKFNDSKRGWCLTAFQGMGALALVAMPLATLFDKKDHGCKW